MSSKETSEEGYPDEVNVPESPGVSRRGLELPLLCVCVCVFAEVGTTAVVNFVCNGMLSYQLMGVRVWGFQPGSLKALDEIVLGAHPTFKI